MTTRKFSEYLLSRSIEAEFGNGDRVCLVQAHSQRGTVVGEMSPRGEYRVRWDDVEVVHGDDLEST